jgi:hypothetical protein
MNSFLRNLRLSANTLGKLQVCLFAMAFILVTPLKGQLSTSFDISSIFELGALLTDDNDDGFPNHINAALILSSQPSQTEIRAASEISLRLGFETMAMDLPI